MTLWHILLAIAAAVVVALAAGWLFRAALVAATRGDLRRTFRGAPLTATFGMLVILIYVLVAVFAPLLAPFAEREVVGGQYLPWAAPHYLGTDNLGRDMLTRLIYGARNTVGIAFATTALAFLLGSVLGLWAATVGGWIDQALSRLVDALMAIPALIFSLLLLTIFGTSVVTLILVIATIDATRVFRLARSVAQGIVVMDYIEAAKLRGEGTWRLITREILPNALAPLVAEFGLRFCFVFLAISALSFLGLGIQPPTADWGSMVRENATLINFGDVTPLLPAGAIALLTVAVNFVVDWQLHRASGLKE
ncbi:MAG: ABC transporter permease [Rhodobacteraceae bacterium]|nr:ABC transporter permease [Paracoccaceae bacterium]